MIDFINKYCIASHKLKKKTIITTDENNIDYIQINIYNNDMIFF